MAARVVDQRRTLSLKGPRVNVLDEIISGVREDVANRQQVTTLAELKARAQDTAPALDAMAALRLDGVAVIAEVKRASPSAGALADIGDPALLAADYKGKSVV